MKALVLTAVKQLEYIDVADPVLQTDEVLVEVKACGICGSDVHGMDGSSGRRIPPVIMGHEAAGVVAAIGQAVEKWQPGDRVTFDSTIYPADDWFAKNGNYNLADNRMVLGVSCREYSRNGAFARFINVPQHILYRIPDNVSYDYAALTEPLAVAVHAINLSDMQQAGSVVVIGTGVIGLLLIQVLKSRKCDRIIAVDLQQERLQLAGKLGAHYTLNAVDINVIRDIQRLTEERGADLVFEAVGIEASVAMAIDSVRKGGSVTLLGNISAEVLAPLQKIVTRQIKIQGSCAINGEYPQALDMIKDNKIDLEAMISVRAPLSEGALWFDRLYNKEKGLLKIILNP